MASGTYPGEERVFDSDRIIVSKTDLKGRITYVNRLFCSIADYTEDELIGRPHNIIRHTSMPRGIFEMLWGRLQAHKEIFAYVINSTKSGDYYWVLAHVTPSFDQSGQAVGYHSNRRAPRQSALDVIRPIYDQMLAIEAKPERRKDGIQASCQFLEQWLQDKGVNYDEFVFSI